MRDDMKTVVLVNNGDWFYIDDCVILFDVHIDSVTGMPVPKNTSRTANLEEICVMALRDAIRNHHPVLSSWQSKL